MATGGRVGRALRRVGRAAAAKKTTATKTAAAKKVTAKQTAAKSAAKKVAAKKTAAKKAATKVGAKKTAAKKTAAKKTAAKSAAKKVAKKTAAKSAAKKVAKKTTAKSAAKKTTAKKITPAKKTAAKNTAAKKTAAKSTAATKVAAKQTGATPAPAKTAKKAVRTTVAAAPPEQMIAGSSPLVTSSVEAVTTPAAPQTVEETPVSESVIIPAQKDAGDVAVPEGTDWTQAELADIRRQLVDELADMHNAYDVSIHDLDELQRSGNDGAGDDQADAGSKTFEREQEQSIAANRFDLMTQMERAVDRIDKGTYGYCERCGKPIPKARLQAFPAATLDVNCKQLEERR